MDTLEQQPLFDESQLPQGWELLLPVERQVERFTGAMVRRNGERYAAIVAALGEGLGIRQICRAFGVSQHTVEGIRERDSALVATDKERTGKQLRRVVRMALGRLEEALENDEITPGQLPVTVGILIDKSLNWDGQSVSTVTIRHELDQSKVIELFRRLQAPVIELEIQPAPEFKSGEDDAFTAINTGNSSDSQSLDAEIRAPACTTAGGQAVPTASRGPGDSP